MKDPSKNFYMMAHLFVSAIRVLEYQNNTPPTLADISQILTMSLERSNYICRKLKEMGIVDSVEGSFGNRLFIRDHLKIEEIPRQEDESKIEEELKKFQESQKGFQKKLKTFRLSRPKRKKICLLKWRKN